MIECKDCPLCLYEHADGLCTVYDPERPFVRCVCPREPE